MRKEGTARGRGERVLIAEDEPALRVLLSEMVEHLGYRVWVAAGGGEALKAVEKEGLRPDLLITGVVMPGMGGRALAERLAGMLPALKVLYTFGYTDNAIAHHGVLEPEMPFLQKPFTVGDLSAKIREVLGG
jgi:CheY-like chemotaxis protein